MRVAAGAIAKKWLARAVRRRRPRLPVAARPDRDAVQVLGRRVRRQSVLRRRRRAIVPQLEEFMDKLRKSGDSVRRADHHRRAQRAGGLGRAGVRQARRRPRLQHDEHQRGEGRRDRRGLSRGGAEGHRAFRRDDAAGFSLEQRGRHPGRHFDRAGHRRARRGQADLEHPARRATRSTCTGKRDDRSRRTAATIRASASARRRSARR